MKRVLNFSPGPATLPVAVLEEASRGVLEIAGSGMSVLEVSHRGKEYEAIHAEAQKRLLSLLELDPKDYAAMFLGGGASLQFAMLPANFLAPGKTADYVHTGEWSIKAIQEAKLYGGVNVVASSEDKKFSYIPKNVKFSPGAAYAHITTNNTIEGTQWSQIPDTYGVPLVADVSSDFLSRKLDNTQFSMTYAGAQKNAGPAGVTLIVAKRSFLESAQTENLAKILSYKTHFKADSLYNTPPAFNIYVAGLVFKWIENQGGVEAVEKVNRQKAGVIYEALDSAPGIYDMPVPNPEDRSQMNIVFRLKDNAREEDFVRRAREAGMDGIKGHRSVGGFRASVYNAFPLEGAQTLAKFIREFAKG